MYSILFLASMSFVSAYLLTPFVRDSSTSLGMVDRPDQYRKLHTLPTPHTGGIAVSLAYVIPVVLLLISPLNGADVVNLPVAVRIAPAALLVLALGVADDISDVEPWMKLVVQAGAAVLAYLAGVQVNGIVGWTAPAWASLPLTIAWLVACTNAFNLIDGVDGVATGVGLFASFTMMAAALLQHNTPLALATAPLVGALLGFLRYNFNPASIFLGDCGSLPIGFLLGCFGALWSQKSTTLLGMTAPFIVLSVPLLDAAIAIARRFLRKQAILKSDRGHIHHRLLARGLSPRQVALAVYAFSGVAATLSLLMSATANRFDSLLLVSFAVAVWLGIRLVGYVEFDTAFHLISIGAFRHVLNGRLYAASVEERVGKARTPDDYWDVVRDIGHECGCGRVEMSLMGHVYAEGNGDDGSTPRSSVVIPIMGGGQVIFRCQPQQSVRHAVAMSAVMDILPAALGRIRVAPVTLATPKSPQAAHVTNEYVASGRWNR
jgi:UDP-GlcNAc:undecaprenyl-phosphate GlcNAc-1-phosphate transferase